MCDNEYVSSIVASKMEISRASKIYYNKYSEINICVTHT